MGYFCYNNVRTNEVFNSYKCHEIQKLNEGHETFKLFDNDVGCINNKSLKDQYLCHNNIFLIKNVIIKQFHFIPLLV